MRFDTKGLNKARTARALPALTPLDREPRSRLPTDEAARHINRAPQTLRLWACSQQGPIQPININGRLAWAVSDLRRVLGA